MSTVGFGCGLSLAVGSLERRGFRVGGTLCHNATTQKL
jgi:hypothetical protein